MTNVVLATDSYKLGHWNQYPEGTEGVYSYLEARKGGEYDEVVFFGLQPILQDLVGAVVTQEAIDQAAGLAELHFGTPDAFNRQGWEHILHEHGGRLPIRVRAVPEGTVVPVGNVLMTVENTDPKCFWLTNAVESLLLHVWHPTTVATRSRSVKKLLAKYLLSTTGSVEGLDFMLHDFGYRGAAGNQAAARGGAGHLVNFLGSDTLSAMLLAIQSYQAEPPVAFSVPATEHSVMTSLGRSGELLLVSDLLDKYPEGILSVVADSFDYRRFVRAVSSGSLKARIMAREGKFVIRPDSITPNLPTPAAVVVWTLDQLWEGETNEQGCRVIPDQYGVLWGDGIDEAGIQEVLAAVEKAGYATSPLVFGMGAGLLQKLNRDTLRFAFKSSAQKRAHTPWMGVKKTPADPTKASKAGRFALIEEDGVLRTAAEGHPGDILETVFEDGDLKRFHTFEEIRQRAALP